MEKLTVEKILERKKVIKPLEMVYHSDFLNGDIEIKKINPDKIAVLLSEAQELGQIKAIRNSFMRAVLSFRKKSFIRNSNRLSPMILLIWFLNQISKKFWSSETKF